MTGAVRDPIPAQPLVASRRPPTDVVWLAKFFFGVVLTCIVSSVVFGMLLVNKFYGFVWGIVWIPYSLAAFGLSLIIKYLLPPRFRKAFASRALMVLTGCVGVITYFSFYPLAPLVFRDLLVRPIPPSVSKIEYTTRWYALDWTRYMTFQISLEDYGAMIAELETKYSDWSPAKLDKEFHIDRVEGLPADWQFFNRNPAKFGVRNFDSEKQYFLSYDPTLEKCWFIESIW